MKKWLLIVCLLTLSACGAEEAKGKKSTVETMLTEEDAKGIAMEVIKEFWQAYESVGTEASLEEKRERLMPFMTEGMFNQVFKEEGRPDFPELPVYTFGVHVTELAPGSLTIEHILVAGAEEESAVKQTTSFIQRDGRFIVSGYYRTVLPLALTKEEAEAFLVEHGYEVVFVKEGPFDAFSSTIEEAYIFRDEEDERIQFVINKKTGFFMIGLVRDDSGAEPDTDGDTTIEEIRAKYAHLFAYRLAEIDADTLSSEQRAIYDAYIIQPIEQAIDIDFDFSLTDEESNHQTKELLDRSVAGMLDEIERTLVEEEVALLQESHAAWVAARKNYAVAMAEASERDQMNHFYSAYKDVTEDYLAYLFYEYLYQ